jgi:hypothetical protein
VEAVEAVLVEQGQVVLVVEVQVKRQEPGMREA